MKITKKERKRMRTPNDMVKRSLNDGKRIMIGSVLYHGLRTGDSPKGRRLPLVRIW